MKEHSIHVNANQCIGCGMCQGDCPADNISITEKKAAVKSQDCIKCGHCVAICPKAAVSMTGFDEPPIELEQQTIIPPQQLLDALKSRRSIRQFQNQPVEMEIVSKIIEAGRFTPSAKNAQTVSYIVLKDGLDRYEAIAVGLFRKLLPLVKLVAPMARKFSIEDDFFFKKAPIAIMVLSQDKISAALAASNMALMAEACGLGVLYNGFFSMAANRFASLRRALGLTRKEQVVATLVLGYSAVTYCRTAQKEKATVRFL